MRTKNPTLKITLDDRVCIWRVVCEYVDKNKTGATYADIYKKTAYTSEFTKRVIKEMIKRNELCSTADDNNQIRYQHRVACSA